MHIKYSINPFEEYKCSYSGCLFKTRKHCELVRHLRRIHITAKSSPTRTSIRGTLNQLSEHVKQEYTVRIAESSYEANWTVAIESLHYSCRCYLTSCGQQICISIKALTKHFNTGHKNDPRDCIFKDCDVKFQQNSFS